MAPSVVVRCLDILLRLPLDVDREEFEAQKDLRLHTLSKCLNGGGLLGFPKLPRQNELFPLE